MVQDFVKKYPQVLIIAVLFFIHFIGIELPMILFVLAGTWSAGGALATARYGLAGCGTQTAGLSFGGLTTENVTTTEEYDGTSWSSGGNLATARHSLAGCGTQSAGLSFGGYVAAASAVTEEYTIEEGGAAQPMLTMMGVGA